MHINDGSGRCKKSPYTFASTFSFTLSSICGFVHVPPTARVVKGPREGFVEDLATNIGLIRKRLKTTNLKIKDITLGWQSKTQIAIIYLDGIVNKKVLKEVERRLSAEGLLNTSDEIGKLTICNSSDDEDFIRRSNMLLEL